MANLQISSVKSTDTSKSVLNSRKVSTAKKTIIEPTPVKNNSYNSNKSKIFFDTMSKYLDIPSENFTIHTDKRGNKYLKISRPKNSDKTEKELYKIEKIKKGLRIKDRVLYNANGKRQGISATTGVFDATALDNMDKLSIASGHYLFVPLSEIGNRKDKKGFIFKTEVDTPENIELRNAVKKYIEN